MLYHIILPYAMLYFIILIIIFCYILSNFTIIPEWRLIDASHVESLLQEYSITKRKYQLECDKWLYGG